ncbi:low affinity iron permease family protein [Sandaracinobacteroides saxicola]|uniref:Low affinity iron permease family protein n=1 Tax=Sandaracinobacteroides saxicola TaxID=2759707 RepID=A0A7G5IKI5_9SPHN|nr:low affinity iron permease family protein [Sandaracinobacteroides saxicola]QMW23877.1 low affinity iron permease family protein [Sandaracinobacteroides saxicola]
MTQHQTLEHRFGRAASSVAHVAGKPATFGLCCLLILGWAVLGPPLHYSENWQLVINTGTTIITFLMVFLIQNTQNRDSAALHAKLDEIIHALDKAENRFIGIEDDDESTIRTLRAEQRARPDLSDPPAPPIAVPDTSPPLPRR